MPTLADIYSAADSFKRRLTDVVSNPLTSAQQMLGYANDRARGLRQDIGQSAQQSMQTGEFITPQDKVMAAQLAEAYNPVGMTVYHGSRHPFTRFDKSKIGTGEGNQSYGYGLYVAEHPQVAKEYSTAGMSIDPAKTKYKGRNIETWYDEAQRKQNMAYRQKASQDKIREVNAELQFWEGLMTRQHPQTLLDEYMNPDYGGPEFSKFAKNIDMSKFKGVVEQPNFYKVDLPDEHIAKMLDFDAPISGQIDAVKALAKQYGVPETDLGGDLLLKIGKGSSGSQIMQNAGLTGIKYFDQLSRDAQKGTRNFVVFDPEHLQILERNQEPIK
jgi:hypothetical protein